jgi:ATP-binding cassette, subfamily C (CFTR/MRP), member 1
MEYHGGWPFLICSNLAILAFTQVRVHNDYLLGVWSSLSPDDQYDEFQHYSGLLISFGFLIALFGAIRTASIQFFSWRATKMLHSDMVKAVLSAPVNLYFDVTPTSRILNVFSKDLNQLEIQMAFYMSTFMGMSYQLLSIAYVAAAAHIYMLILLPVTVGFSVDLV